MTQSGRWQSLGGTTEFNRALRTESAERFTRRLESRLDTWHLRDAWGAMSDVQRNQIAELAGLVTCELVNERAMVLAQETVNANVPQADHDATTAVFPVCPLTNQSCPVVHASSPSGTLRRP